MMLNPRFIVLSFLIFGALSFNAISLAQTNAERYDQAASYYQRGDVNKAATLWGELAAEGDANSQYAMAIMHLKKEVRQASDTKAFTLLSDAAKQQHLAAMFNLGVAYWEGKGTKKQTAKALNWWEIAAQRQDAGAQYNLGLAYYIGEGRAQDNDKAAYWLQQAADNNHPQARNLLADIQAANDSSVVSAPAGVNNPLINKPKAKLNSTNTKKTNLSKANTRANTKASVATNVVANKPRAIFSIGSTQTIQTLSTLRAKPSATAAHLATLNPGDAVKIVQSLPNWSKIIAPQGYAVWVFDKFLQNAANGLGQIKGTNVNLRPRPSTNNASAPPLGSLQNGEKVAIVLKRGGWTQIIPSKALPAWVPNSAFGQNN